MWQLSPIKIDCSLYRQRNVNYVSTYRQMTGAGRLSHNLDAMREYAGLAGGILERRGQQTQTRRSTRHAGEQVALQEARQWLYEHNPLIRSVGQGYLQQNLSLGQFVPHARAR